MRDLERDLAGHQALDVGTLAVGVGPVIAETRLAPTLVELVRNRPGLRIQVHADNWQALTRALEDGEIELFVGEPPELEHASDFRLEPLTADPGVFLFRLDHPLSRRRSVSLDDVRAHPLLAPRLPNRILDWIYPPGTAPRQIVECESFAVLAAVVAECDAVAVAPLSVVADQLVCGG
jgi:DNA-binding transcriptional LysR family regulator